MAENEQEKTNEKQTTPPAKLTLRAVKCGDQSAWAPIAATEEVSPESQTV